MKVQGTYRGRTYKEVTIEFDESEDQGSDELLIGFAMREVSESPSSLFGWHVERPAAYPLVAVVTLNTD